MNFKNTLSLLCIVIPILVLSVGCVKEENRLGNSYSISEEDKLVVFTSHKKEIYEPIIKAFEEKTGIWVNVIYGGTTDLLNTIKEEEDNYLCDIMFGGSAESLEDSSDYFLPYRCTEYDKLNSQILSKDDKWTPFSNLPLVIITNNKTVYPAAAPRGWEELLHFIWEGKVALANPQISGSSYTAIAMLLQLSDEEDEVVINHIIKQIGGAGESSSGAAIDSVANASKQIGITLETTAWQYIEAGENLSIIYPIEGTAIIPDGTAILKNAKHIENAQKFIDFTVAKGTQEMIVNRFYRRAVRGDISFNEKLPSNIVTMDFDVKWASKNRENILKLWNNKFK